MPRTAIVGIGCSEISRDSGTGPGTLIARASRSAILDSGVGRDEIDGVVGVYSTDSPTVAPAYVVQALGLPNVSFAGTAQPPTLVALATAAHAVAAGSCDTVLCYHGKYRWATTSLASRGDPLRQPPPQEMDPYFSNPFGQSAGSLNWAARVMRHHMHQYGSTREDFARIAINNRTYAVNNPRALFRDPLTLDGYLSAPMIDDPMSLYDMDPPVDGAMAVVVTTEERAVDLAERPVFIESLAACYPARNEGLLWPEADVESARRAIATLFARLDRTPADIDLAYPYDGFTILTMVWLEALFTEPGGGPDLLREAWSDQRQTLLLLGRIPMCTNGGNLSEGRATQGFGGVLEAVAQMRGTAGDRQLPGHPSSAVITNGMAGTNQSAVLAID